MNFKEQTMTAKEIEREAYKEYCRKISDFVAVYSDTPVYTQLDNLCDVWWKEYNQTLKENYIVEFKGGFEFAI